MLAIFMKPRGLGQRADSHWLIADHESRSIEWIRRGGLFMMLDGISEDLMRRGV